MYFILMRVCQHTLGRRDFCIWDSCRVTLRQDESLSSGELISTKPIVYWGAVEAYCSMRCRHCVGIGIEVVVSSIALCSVAVAMSDSSGLIREAKTNTWGMTPRDLNHQVRHYSSVPLTVVILNLTFRSFIVHWIQALRRRGHVYPTW